MNLKFSDLLNESRSVDEHPDLISIDTCDLHTIQKAFQNGAKDGSWSAYKFLQATWNILDHSPSRRADYERITCSTAYPLQFFSHRSMEIENVAKRAESI